ncbi:MAG: signal recognition particle-docking protein FtsY [Gemmatimonadales bacterium]|nr:MAG: signal recognition particle-docking protein FtsY [Gemmatimonadales bacterium]
MRLFRKKDETRKSIWKRVVDLALTDVRVLSSGMDDESLEELEERLLAADFGVPATLRLVQHVEDLARRGKIRGGGQLRDALRAEVARILEGDGGASGAARPAGDGATSNPRDLAENAGEGPTVYLVVGVNGVGKTTSIAKLAHYLVQQGRSVLVAAGDTYRAGAVKQLETWAGRVGADFVRGKEGGDPAAVAYDAVEAGIARGADVVIVDTAGRLHTNRGLMEELRKVDRVIRRRLEGAPHETLIVLDATVGQNAVAQVRAFGQAVELTGIVLAKMDSSARGGIVVALREEFGLPVKLVGLGEKVEDLDAFDPEDFLQGVFEGER